MSWEDRCLWPQLKEESPGSFMDSCVWNPHCLAHCPSHKSTVCCKKKGRAGGVAQVVEHLPSKCEALSSNPRRKKKEERRRRKGKQVLRKQRGAFLPHMHMSLGTCQWTWNPLRRRKADAILINSFSHLGICHSLIPCETKCSIIAILWQVLLQKIQHMSL
jgi:hypothetical protein